MGLLYKIYQSIQENEEDHMLSKEDTEQNISLIGLMVKLEDGLSKDDPFYEKKSKTITR